MKGNGRAARRASGIKEFRAGDAARGKKLPGRKRSSNRPLTVIADNDFVDQALATGPGTRRVRVRTPGKHIVLFALAVTFMLALSTTVLRSGALPEIPHRATGDYRAPAMQFLTDLSPDASGRAAFLKLKATIVARDRQALAEIESKEAEIRERISFFLRQLSPEDFAGAEAMARMKAELTKRASLPVAPGAVKDVIVDEMMVQ